MVAFRAGWRRSRPLNGASIGWPASTRRPAWAGGSTPSRSIVFNFLGVLAVYALQRLQGVLPLNPAGMPAVGADSSFNTAISFVTNTNWQGYVGESTMSYLTQMLALAVQNFFSAATGIVVVIALVRGFVARSSASIGNFWVDITRVTAYVLLPLSLVFAVFLVSQGVIQNFSPYKDVTTLDVTDLPAAEERSRWPAAEGRQGQPGAWRT